MISTTGGGASHQLVKTPTHQLVRLRGPPPTPQLMHSHQLAPKNEKYTHPFYRKKGTFLPDSAGFRNIFKKKLKKFQTKIGKNSRKKYIKNREKKSRKKVNFL